MDNGGHVGGYQEGEGGLPQHRGTTPEELERAYRETMRELNAIRGALGDDKDLSRELYDLTREMQQFDPGRFKGNPALIDQMRAQILPNIQQLEMQLRRKVEEKTSGQVRSGAAERVPAGYADAVADYFRRLSRGGK